MPDGRPPAPQDGSGASGTTAALSQSHRVILLASIPIHGQSGGAVRRNTMA